MRKGSAEPMVRRNISLTQSFATRLEELKQRRGAVSESEIIRQGIALLEAVSDPDVEIVLRDRKTSKEKTIVMVST